MAMGVLIPSSLVWLRVGIKVMYIETYFITVCIRVCSSIQFCKLYIIGVQIIIAISLVTQAQERMVGPSLIIKKAHF